MAHRVFGFSLALCLVALTLWLRAELSETFGGQRPLMILFVIPVMACAYFGGWRAGLLATALAGAGTAYFKSPPDFLLNAKRPEDAFQWVILIATGVGVSLAIKALKKASDDAVSAREKERDSNAYAQRILSATPIVLGTFDLVRQRVVTISTHVKILLGYTQQEFCAFEDLIPRLSHPDDVAHVVENLQKIATLPDGEAIEFVHRWKHRAGHWVTLLTSGAVFQRDKDGNAVQSIHTSADVSSLIEMQVRLKRSNEELEQFASVAAHDLRSPLRSLRGWIDLLEGQLKGASREAETSVGYVKRAALRMERLIDDLLSVARLSSEASLHETVHLGDTVRNVLDDIKDDIATTGAEVAVGRLPTVKGTPGSLHSVFLNLLRNAVAYREPSRPLKIAVEARDFVDSTEIYVIDNGIGIAPEYTARIFDMFTRLHSEKTHPGTGIGLAYCKKAVELHGGSISVKSAEGIGSTFIVRLPRGQS